MAGLGRYGAAYFGDGYRTRHWWHSTARQHLGVRYCNSVQRALWVQPAVVVGERVNWPLAIGSVRSVCQGSKSSSRMQVCRIVHMVGCWKVVGQTRNENGRLKYLMPHALTHSANALWETNNIVQLIYMQPGHDDPSGEQYIMHEDDEKALAGQGGDPAV
ncbi:hypothetical protein VOLCADRAFT_91146 [Volvox carteri f. nagariensis]|uniref:Uncharacterized protein n=1 Tax=Volvox carteri f. nagariensis TaxID=3068 RepID=D8TWA7_VOLCA|nr:uncharacterized protein VOLCADRAFT_91146 [Volvox carteri f. nagariensis]EFJ48443.1 hypothetical protein VOLCADRAFT_91146 [Volvox carteri f. nagariensis]|eukprot:XP_002950697.1 hypothetical protein VOLCADRAFT_91146 [Volvox carteri f. nagariensis]